MATKNSNTYIIVKSKNESDLLCPLSAERAEGVGNSLAGDDCFEKDVAERYSGNIKIVSFLSQYSSRFLGLFNSFLIQVNIGPPGKPVFLVPGTLSMP